MRVPFDWWFGSSVNPKKGFEGKVPKAELPLHSFPLLGETNGWEKLSIKLGRMGEFSDPKVNMAKGV